ncbi:MAG: hypothetical protein COV75_08655 [Candidatus Omnitrophica bacterium CG11_big_fil_rev_8_21_14_0_20_63_9]|nr:MAG: hypothetical protein COV75_08655 [Candidatus Omnitrophica bacterium CG11_big_fil_rev_8_21_14_0_20_63_9]
MSNRRGQTMVLAYVAVFVITVLGGSLLNHSLTSTRHNDIDQLYSETFYLTEGGVEDASAKFAQAIANFQVDANTVRYPAVGSLVTTFASGGTASSVITEAEPAPRTIVDPDDTAVFVKNYEIVTTAQHPLNANISVTLHQVVGRRIIYTFQHAVFYDADLEWLPGPNMTLSGRVHSNSDMYLGTHNILTVDSEYLRAVGSIYNRRKDSTQDMNGSVQILKAGSSPATYPVMSIDSSSPTWFADSQTTWSGTVKSGVHGVVKRSVPVVGSTQPGGYYDTNADVKVVNGTLTKGGVTLMDGSNPACNTDTTYCVPPGTITTVTTMKNNRENAYVRMTNIDIGRLGGGTYGGKTYPSQMPANGLVYATRDDAPSGQQPGVRLVNGSEVKRAGGLTVVSNDPVYVQGNYNTVSKKPCAVIGDAMNLLSNNWNDANSASSLSSRPATGTTINAAFIAGINTTTTGQYNGGLENYPRLHEKWDGQTLTIQGSFVSLWNSQIGTGPWSYGGMQYTAPIRNWAWDTSFGSGTNLPPFTPWSVEMDRGAWWRQ